MTIFLTWGLFRSCPPRQRWFWIFAAGTQTVGLLVTFSRSAWLAFLIGFFALLSIKFWKILINPRTLWGIFVSFGLLGLIGLVAIYSSPELGDRVTSIFSPTYVPEVEWRTLVWQYSLNIVRDNPLFGTGTSIIEDSAAMIPGSGRLERYSTHNLLIDIAYQRGLIALSLFLVFWLIYLYNGWRLYTRKILSEPERDYYLGFMIAGISFLVSGMGSALMVSENFSTLFWALFGCVLFLRAARTQLSWQES